MTREAYLAFERASLDGQRHEFHDGELFPVEGATRNHSRIARNLGTLIHTALRGRPCEAFGMDLGVRIPGKDRYKYPDLSVAYPPQYEDMENDVLINPTILSEILSPTTEKYDRGGKFEDYATIPSLMEYVLLAQDRVFVEHRIRQEGGWFLRLLHEGDALRLTSIGVEVPLAEIYLNVFDPAAAL